MNNDSSGIGELLVPILLASVAAVLMAVAGLVFSIFLCARFTYWGTDRMGVSCRSSVRAALRGGNVRRRIPLVHSLR